MVSRTSTLKLAAEELPRVSDAVHVTFDVPNANVEPDAGEQDTGRAPSTMSVAVSE